MDLRKSWDFIDPTSIGNDRIHIIGCGSVGSTLAENLARFGFVNFNLYDFDKVEGHNLANQMFSVSDIGREKVDAVRDMIVRINPEAEGHIRLRPGGYTDQNLGGYVFLCVDKISTRRSITERLMSSVDVKAMFDFRTGLTKAQHYGADWRSQKDREIFLKSMDFTDEEADAETPMSACGVALCVCPTVRIICGYGASNFVNFLKGEPIKKFVLIDAFRFRVESD
ncbi:MAG: ThiF family adenylyltransferase [Bacteroides sp.]|nr:ThiF family adenylyltransferase [Eubacterium sp.]MCM1418153.1 ThiF family adenylyltransferase [Roseburia sp.]MCM1462322.1 ThiF family adenylyltransferase [Bacteroides sp.]